MCLVVFTLGTSDIIAIYNILYSCIDLYYYDFVRKILAMLATISPSFCLNLPWWVPFGRTF
jgi:hypothetical protein